MDLFFFNLSQPEKTIDIKQQLIPQEEISRNRLEATTKKEKEKKDGDLIQLCNLEGDLIQLSNLEISTINF